MKVVPITAWLTRIEEAYDAAFAEPNDSNMDYHHVIMASMLHQGYSREEIAVTMRLALDNAKRRYDTSRRNAFNEA